MAITHPLKASEKATIDPGDARGPWTFTLPLTTTNGTACTIKAIADDATPLTVQAQGTATVEDPETPGTAAPTMAFSFRGVGAVEFTYNAGRDQWVIYSAAALTSVLLWRGIWNGTTAYQRNDLVRHEGQVWIADVDNLNVQPGIAFGVATWVPLLYPGSGGMDMTAPELIGTIDSGWTILDQFDNNLFTPYGITTDPLGGTFTFEFLGLWQESFSLFFAHNSSNSGRITYVRLWNVTAGAELARVPIGVGRNVEDTNSTFTILSRFSEADIGATLRWEIGGGDSFSAVTLEILRFDTHQVSP